MQSEKTKRTGQVRDERDFYPKMDVAGREGSGDDLRGRQRGVTKKSKRYATRLRGRAERHQPKGIGETALEDNRTTSK